MRSCSNIEQKPLNNTFLNIIEFFFFNLDHRIKKFSNNINLRKLNFLSEEKISERSRFVSKDVMQSWFYKIGDFWPRIMDKSANIFELRGRVILFADPWSFLVH